MSQSNKEANIILALQAYQNNPELGLHRAAEIFQASYGSLWRRTHGISSRYDIIPKSRKLSDLEEQAIIRFILDPDSRGFPPRLRGIEEMANRLLADRDASPVGKRWASNFVKRHKELKTRFFRAERRGRPKSVQPGNREWVTVIQAINAEGWAIQPFIVVAGQYHLANWYRESNLPGDWAIATTQNGWTDNETGLEWLKHFDRCTAKRSNSRYRLLILDGHESHHSVEFEEYCNENKIITLCMPPHSSHLLQPLDVGCFGLLKKAYGREIERLIRCSITYVSKTEFFLAFTPHFKLR
ncbi:hypothetical protein BFJ70_g16481 [Fusarium oxysporum]|nr:hypothetical protein BFJ70_g16481 [Fusarium oxysporum]